MEKRDAICESALELFAERGIKATTIRDIADRADASAGALYRHFDGKADLAAWLYDRCTGELRERLQTFTKGASTPQARLEALVRGLFDFYASKPSSCHYLMSNQPGEDEAEPAAPVRLFADVLRSTQMNPAGLSPVLQAGWILATVQRTVRLLKAGTLDIDEQAAIDQTVEAVLKLSEGKSTMNTG